VAGRIVFIAPFPKAQVSGGIKTVYRHAEILAGAGFQTFIYQPDGHPTWFESRARLIPRLFETAEGDVLVFPESLDGPIAELARQPTPARKVLFVQAHAYALLQEVPPGQFLGFTHFAAPSEIAKGFLQRVLRFPDVAVLPCIVDPVLFAPHTKRPLIAFLPQKRTREAIILRSLFQLKYPALKSVPWQAIENTPERETAMIFGAAQAVLALPWVESFGLVPLEAMAAGAVVVGFDGYGGKEFATTRNGLWLPPDHFEETADALARVLTQWDTPFFAAMREDGAATAARYNREAATAVLQAFYGSLM
jgi:hypothetical protein